MATSITPPPPVYLATGGTATIGLTSPAITTPGTSASSVQIGQRFTYSVSFVVPVTGADNLVLTSTLAPGLAYATASGSVTCTVAAATPSDSGCITLSPVSIPVGQPPGPPPTLADAAALQAIKLGPPSASSGAGSRTFSVALGGAGTTGKNPGIRYTTAANAASPTPTVQVNVSYDVYVADPTVTPGGPADTSPATVVLPSGGGAADTTSAAYDTVPGGVGNPVASVPDLTSSSPPITVINPLLTAPTVAVSQAHAEVGVTNPGPDLVQVFVTVTPATLGTAYATTVLVTLPDGLLAVNGADEAAYPAGNGTPVCAGPGGITCVVGQGAGPGVDGAPIAPFSPAATTSPTTCTLGGSGVKPDPAVVGSTVAAQITSLPPTPDGSNPFTLTFDACVVPGTTFGTGSETTVKAAETWYSQTPPAQPDTATGSPAAHEYPTAGLPSTWLTGITTLDFTGTTSSVALASAGANYTIGDAVPYAVTVGLPEATSPNLDPGTGGLPAFYVCVFIPAGMTFGTATTAPSTGPGITGPGGAVAAPTALTSGFHDTNCESQLAAQQSGTTMAELDYPAGWTVAYDGAYGNDTFTQPFTLVVGPDPTPLGGGSTATAAVSAGVMNRSQTATAPSGQITVVAPELSLAATIGTPTAAAASYGPGSPVPVTVTLTNANKDSLSAPANNAHVQMKVPAATTTLLASGIVTSGPAGQPAKQTHTTTWTPVVTTSPPGAGFNTIDYTDSAPVLPGTTTTFTFTFHIQGLVLNGTPIPVTADLVAATTQAAASPPAAAGRTYSSSATPRSLQYVAPGQASLNVVGPTAVITATITGPAGTVAPGSTPTYTITVTNNGPSPIGAVKVSVSSTPQLTGVLITPTSGRGTYSQSSGLWTVPLATSGPNQSAQLTVTGTVPQTATGTITVSTVATTGPGVEDLNPAKGKASVTEPLQTAVDISVKVTQQGSLFSGSVATYTITVANAGPSAAGNITLTDTLPAGTGFKDASGSGWVCGKILPLACTFAGPLAAGKSTQVVTDVIIDTATGQNVTDTATVATASDTNPTNNTASVIGTVLAAEITTAGGGAGSTPATQTGSSGATSVTAGAPGATSSSPASSAAALASTGDNEQGQAGFALVLLLAGLLLVLITRFRRPVPAVAVDLGGGPQGGGARGGGAQRSGVHFGGGHFGGKRSGGEPVDGARGPAVDGAGALPGAPPSAPPGRSAPA